MTRQPLKPDDSPLIENEECEVSKVETWHENDDLWKITAPFMFGEHRWAAASSESEQVVSWLQVKPGAKILDLCCGPGIHALELARRGFEVTGVDRTAIYLERGRQHAEAGNLKVEFVQDDMRSFCRPNAFDGAIMMFTSFGYFEDPAENRQVLINVYQSLKEKGRFIIDMTGKEVLARIFSERDWSEQDGVFFLEERTVSKDWQWMENRWIVLRGQECYEFTVSHWVYSAAELTELLKECGFSAIEVYGDFTSTPYDHTARRLIAVAYKESQDAG